jgi:hypothetical protein
LVEQGITSISLNPDAAIKTQLVIAAEEGVLSGGQISRPDAPLTHLTASGSVFSQHVTVT